MADQRSRCILVIGIHRSGTSLIAGILDRLGVPMGQPIEVGDDDPTIVGGDGTEWPVYPDSNPLGQYEDDDFVQACNGMMGNWRFPRTHLFAGEGAVVAREVIERRQAAHSLWGLKTPQLCLTFPLLWASFDEPRLLITQREFGDSVASLIARERELPLPVAQDIQSEYWRGRYLCAVLALKHQIPVAAADYENVLAEPEQAVRKLASYAFEGREFPDEVRIQAAIDFVEPSLNHHPSEAVVYDRR